MPTPTLALALAIAAGPRILWVGNSLTYSPGSPQNPALPKHFARITQPHFEATNILNVGCLNGAASLQDYYSDVDDQMQQCKRAIAQRNAYDYIVVNEQSANFGWQAAQSWTGTIIPNIKKRTDPKATLIFYLHHTKHLTKAFTKDMEWAAQQIPGARIAPCAMTIDALIKLKGENKLYADDVHYTSLGQYANAATIYAAITGHSPEHLAHYAPHGESTDRQARRAAWDAYAAFANITQSTLADPTNWTDPPQTQPQATAAETTTTHSNAKPTPPGIYAAAAAAATITLCALAAATRRCCTTRNRPHSQQKLIT